MLNIKKQQRRHGRVCRSCSLRKEDAQSLQRHDENVTKWLADTPDDPTGKNQQYIPNFKHEVPLFIN